MSSIKNKTEEEQQSKRRLQVIELYKTRLVYLKNAQVYIKEDKFMLAVDAYNKYLGTLALYFDTKEDKLTPNLFDPKKDLTEMLLVSHAYWDLAKAYDRTPSLQKEALRCLEQFAKFTIGFKYQHVNAQMVRKYIQKKQAHNLKAFEAIYHRIQVSSKKCYIATHCFGETHPKTEMLRTFKKRIADKESGKDFIDIYYRLSPAVVDILEQHPALNKFITQMIAKPFLNFFILMIKPYVHN